MTVVKGFPCKLCLEVACAATGVSLLNICDGHCDPDDVITWLSIKDLNTRRGRTDESGFHCVHAFENQNDTNAGFLNRTEKNGMIF